jgi:hypothetical protein
VLVKLLPAVVNGRDPCEVADRHALAVEALRGGVDVCGLLQVEYGAFGFGLQRGELGERLDDFPVECSGGVLGPAVRVIGQVRSGVEVDRLVRGQAPDRERQIMLGRLGLGDPLDLAALRQSE